MIFDEVMVMEPLFQINMGNPQTPRRGEDTVHPSSLQRAAWLLDFCMITGLFKNLI